MLQSLLSRQGQPVVGKTEDGDLTEAIHTLTRPIGKDHPDRHLSKQPTDHPICPTEMSTPGGRVGLADPGREASPGRTFPSCWI